jgi:hypothetical protein
MSFHIENDIIKKSHPNLKTVWYATAGWRNEILRCAQKTKDLATRNPLKRQWTQVLRKGNSSCTHRVTLVCPLSFMTQIFCNRKLSYGGDHKTFEVITAKSLVFCVVYCRSLFSLLSFRPLYCLSFCFLCGTN